MRVLLVEDDITAARGVALMLKSSGAVVNHVGSRSFAGNKRISATVNAGSRCWRSGPEANAQRNFLC